MFDELENQIVENGTVKAVTTHFSTFALINKNQYEKVWYFDGAVDSVNNKKMYIETVFDAYSNVYKPTLSRYEKFIEILYKRCSDELMDNEVYPIYHANTSVGWGSQSNGQSLEYDLIVDEKNYTNLIDSEYRYLIIFVNGTHIKGTGYEEYYNFLTNYVLQNNITVYVLDMSNTEKQFMMDFVSKVGGEYYSYSTLNTSRILDKIPFEYLKDGKNNDLLTDSNGDGITDYYTKLIMDGKIPLSNSSNELAGIDFNYDYNGCFSDDWDGDGLKNGEEIEVVKENGKTFLKMNSHPLRAYSDGDIYNDFEEIQNVTDPLTNNLNRNDVDWLTNDMIYSYENIADDLRNNDALKALFGYSSVINGVYNKSELYRDLIIDYYSTYITQDIVDEAVLQEEKANWFDYLVTIQSNAYKYGVQPYEIANKVNVMINFINGYAIYNGDVLKNDFSNQVTAFILDIDKLSKDATEMNFQVNGNPYIKEYLDCEKVIANADKAVAFMNRVSNDMTILSCGIDVIDMIYEISVVNANNQIFMSNEDALTDLIIYSDEDAISSAAIEVKKILNKKYIDVCLDEGYTDVIEDSGVDVLLYYLSEKCQYIAIVTATRDVATLLFNTKADLQQAYRILCYSELCNAYICSLKNILKTSDSDNYYWTFDTALDKVYNRLSNIAQIRVLGEQEYYKYVKGDGLTAFIVDSVSGLSDVIDNVNHSTFKVKEKIDSLRLFVSSKLVYSVG